MDKLVFPSEYVPLWDCQEIYGQWQATMGRPLCDTWQKLLLFDKYNIVLCKPRKRCCLYAFEYHSNIIFEKDVVKTFLEKLWGNISLYHRKRWFTTQLWNALFMIIVLKVPLLKWNHSSTYGTWHNTWYVVLERGRGGGGFCLFPLAKCLAQTLGSYPSRYSLLPPSN